MYKLTLDIKNMDDVKKLVDIVRHYDFSIDIMCQQYVVDAKSILGILSLDLSQPVHMYARSNDCNDLFEKISIFVHEGAEPEWIEG